MLKPRSIITNKYRKNSEAKVYYYKSNIERMPKPRSIIINKYRKNAEA